MPARPRTVSGRLISLGHRPSTAATTPCPRFAALIAAPSPTAAARSNYSQACRDDRAKALMIADGFTACATGLATAHSQRVVAGGGGRTIEAARLKITEAGRQALTEEPA